MTIPLYRYKKLIAFAMLVVFMPIHVQACYLSDLARPFTACCRCIKNTTTVVVGGGISLLGAVLYKKQADQLNLYKKTNAELSNKLAAHESKKKQDSYNKDPYKKIALQLNRENKELKRYIMTHQKMKNLPTIKEEEKKD